VQASKKAAIEAFEAHGGKDKKLSDVERGRLDVLALLCIDLDEAWQNAWLKPIHTFAKDMIKQKTKLRQWLQREAKKQMERSLALLSVEHEFTTWLLDLVMVVVCERMYHARLEPASACFGEEWYVDDLKGPESSNLVASPFTCAEARALRCVARGLRNAQPLMPAHRPPCCFVRCALAACVGMELHSEAGRRRLWALLKRQDSGCIGRTTKQSLLKVSTPTLKDLLPLQKGRRGADHEWPKLAALLSRSDLT
jgi:hypothetical protein